MHCFNYHKVICMNKFESFKNKLKDRNFQNLKVNLSPAKSYRNRCEFSYQKNHYVMYKNNKKVYIKNFDIASNGIQKVMPVLLQKINSEEILNKKLFQVNFRSNDLNNVIVTLIYHKTINNFMIEKTISLSEELDIDLIIRAKNYFYSTSNNFIEYKICYKNLVLYQTDNCFFQPNKFLLNKMIKKVINMIYEPNDLLELYCGVGTFTVPLSFYFKSVLASENDRNSIKCLNKSLEVNKIFNVKSLRLSANEVSELLNGKKFNRMGNNKIKNYDFSHILIDPPRSGLSHEVIKIIKHFKNIIYISCNPDTYLRDLNLLKSHRIFDIELFDQFPNTNHLEIVSLLTKKD